MAFTTLLTSQVISVAFYSEREKSDKFWSEALILAWGSFTCRKSTTRDSRLYSSSEGSHTQDFYALKNPSIPAGFEPAYLGSSDEYDNQGTTGVDLLVVNLGFPPATEMEEGNDFQGELIPDNKISHGDTKNAVECVFNYLHLQSDVLLLDKLMGGSPGDVSEEPVT